MALEVSVSPTAYRSRWTGLFTTVGGAGDGLVALGVRHQLTMSEWDKNLNMTTVHDGLMRLISSEVHESSGLDGDLLVTMRKVGIFVSVQKHQRRGFLGISLLVAGVLTVRVDMEVGRFGHGLDLERRVPILIDTKSTAEVDGGFLCQAADQVGGGNTSGPTGSILRIRRIARNSVKEILDL
jgi:hypothetical protein